MKNIIVVTGGAGFVGSNMIELLLKKTNYKIISLDDYSSGSIQNHFKNKKLRYMKVNIKNIFKTLKKYKSKIHSIFQIGRAHV